MRTRYWIWVDLLDTDYREVDKEAYVQYERASGFYNTMGQPEEPATVAFGTPGVKGKQTYEED